jgi:hypothetical protein
MTQQVAETVVRYRVDQGSVQQAVAANQRVADSNKNVVASSQSGLRFARNDNTVGSGYGTVRSLGAAFGQVAGMGEAGGVVGALAGLGLELGVVGLAAGATTLLFRALSEETARVATETKKRLDVETQLSRALQDATRKQAESRLAAAQDDLAFAQNRRTELGNETVPITPALIASLFTSGLVKDGTMEAYNQAIAEQEVAITAAQAAVEFWTAAIGSNTVGINTATEEQLAQADRVLKIDQMTREEREKRIAQIDRDMFVLQTQAQEAGKTTDAGKALSAQIEELRTEYRQLTDTGDTYADTLEREKQAKELVTKQYDNYLDALTLEIEIREEMAETVAKINQIIAERDEALRELAADRAERRLEIEAEYSERLAEIAQNSADRIAAIHRDAGREQFAAIAARDALAFYQSQIKAKDALDDQRQSDQRAQEQLRRHLDKQEAQLDKSYQKQVAQLYASSQKQIDIQQRALMQQQVDLQNAQNAINAIALTGSGGQVVIHTQMWQAINNVAVTMVANTINTINSLLSSLGGSGGGSGGGGGGGGFGIGAQSTFNRMFDQRFSQTLRASGANR